MQSPLNVLFVRFLPVQVSRLWSRFMGLLFFSLNRQHKRIIQNTAIRILKNKNVSLPCGSASKIIIGIIDHYHEKLIAAYYDLPSIDRFIHKRIAITNGHLINSALKQNKGLILVTAHFGGVELIPETLAFRDYSLALLVKFKTPRLKIFTLKRAAIFHTRIIDAESDNVFAQLTQVLKENRILFTQCDEFKKWKPSKTDTIRFLGSEMPVDRTLDILRSRTGAPVVLALMVRHPKNTYSLNIHRIKTTPQDSISKQCMSILEKYIYAYPQAWYQWKDFHQHLSGIPYEH
ncbi:MAG: lysophospholipid acyltransferase family protein [Pseudomonadota bacterium]